MFIILYNIFNAARVSIQFNLAPKSMPSFQGVGDGLTHHIHQSNEVRVDSSRIPTTLLFVVDQDETSTWSTREAYRGFHCHTTGCAGVLIIIEGDLGPTCQRRYS